MTRAKSISRAFLPGSVRFALAIVTLAVAAGSAGARVRVESDPDARFEGRTTFAFKGGDAAAKFREDEPFLDKDLRRVITEQLQAKGLRLVEGQADLLVAYGATTQQRLDVREDPCFHPRRWWCDDDIEIRSYDEITYTVNVHDGPSGELMWRGRASEPEAREGRVTRQVERLVKKLLTRYPPR